MALGDTDDLACSQHGRQNPVVLYCHTCQLLLCPRCVSHGPAGEEPSHRDHTYLEIRDAHDMLKVCYVAIYKIAVATVPSRRYCSSVGHGTVKTAPQPTMLSLTPTILTLTLTG